MRTEEHTCKPRCTRLQTTLHTLHTRASHRHQRVAAWCANASHFQPLAIKTTTLHYNLQIKRSRTIFTKQQSDDDLSTAVVQPQAASGLPNLRPGLRSYFKAKGAVLAGHKPHHCGFPLPVHLPSGPATQPLRLAAETRQTRIWGRLVTCK